MRGLTKAPLDTNNSTGNLHYFICERLNLKSHVEVLKNQQGIIFISSKYKTHTQPHVSRRMAQILICGPSLFFTYSLHCKLKFYNYSTHLHLIKW